MIHYTTLFKTTFKLKDFLNFYQTLKYISACLLKITVNYYGYLFQFHFILIAIA